MARQGNPPGRGLGDRPGRGADDSDSPTRPDGPPHEGDQGKQSDPGYGHYGAGREPAGETPSPGDKPGADHGPGDDDANFRNVDYAATQGVDARPSDFGNGSPGEARGRAASEASRTSPAASGVPPNEAPGAMTHQRKRPSR